MDSEDYQDLLEFALRPVVAFFTLMIPYTIIAALLGQIHFKTQIKAELVLVIVALCVFAVDYFLQNLLKEDVIGKLVFVIFIAFFGYFGYRYALTGFNVLLGQRIGRDWMIASGFQAYFLIFWIHRTIKLFCQKFWNLDIV